MTSGIEKKADNGSLLIAAGLLAAVLHFGLLPALLAGLLVHETVNILARRLTERKIMGAYAKAAVVFALSALVLLLLTAACWGIVVFFKKEAGSPDGLLLKIAEIIENSRHSLPDSLSAYLPEDSEEIRSHAAEWFRANARKLEAAGKAVGKEILHMFVGAIIGVMLSLRDAAAAYDSRPLSVALGQRAERFNDSFRSVFFAQIKIAALNAFFTWCYVGVVLPLFGIHLPLVKTMVMVTFFMGLLPVIGNLVSNTFVIIVSLSGGIYIAAASLIFLVVIHKLEYFLNARIVGDEIKCRAWELLSVMLLMEAVFGMSGMIAAPLYYAYLKKELSEYGLV